MSTVETPSAQREGPSSSREEVDEQEGRRGDAGPAGGEGGGLARRGLPGPHQQDSEDCERGQEPGELVGRAGEAEAGRGAQVGAGEAAADADAGPPGDDDGERGEGEEDRVALAGVREHPADAEEQQRGPWPDRFGQQPEHDDGCQDEAAEETSPATGTQEGARARGGGQQDAERRVAEGVRPAAADERRQVDPEHGRGPNEVDAVDVSAGGQRPGRHGDQRALVVVVDVLAGTRGGGEQQAEPDHGQGEDEDVQPGQAGAAAGQQDGDSGGEQQAVEHAEAGGEVAAAERGGAQRGRQALEQHQQGEQGDRPAGDADGGAGVDTRLTVAEAGKGPGDSHPKG
ncbi:hypothetical protein ACFQZC_30220 [Streptacidiphilus monticola]